MGNELMMSLMRFRRIPHHQNGQSILHPGEKHTLFMILKLTRDRPEGIRVSDISKALQVAPPTVTQKIRTLEEKGMITRTHSEKDRRTVLITLSRKGKKHLDEVHDAFLERCTSLIEHLGEEESRQFLDTLNRSYQFFQGSEKKESCDD